MAESIESQVAVLKERVSRAQSDIDGVGHLARNNANAQDKKIEDLPEEVSRLRDIVMKYKWLLGGEPVCVCFSCRWICDLYTYG